MRRRVMIEVTPTEGLASFSAAASVSDNPQLPTRSLPKLDHCAYDAGFEPLGIPACSVVTETVVIDSGDVEQTLYGFDGLEVMEVSEDPAAATYLVRAEVEEDELTGLMAEAAASDRVLNVFSDPEITTVITCGSSGPVGTDADVERLLCRTEMDRCTMSGRGVMVAIVDTGVNVAYLQAQGKNPNFDASNSWAWSAAQTPGQMPVGHGTMCAFDALIAAPDCTLIDVALLRSVSFTGLLSDAVRAYRHLLNVLQQAKRSGQPTALVVNNSWGMFPSTWDLPVGDPGNYSDNPNHPFNRMVDVLEAEGADILFAAGNCGPTCPDGRCQNVTSNTIYGANGHPKVLTVGGVDINKDVVGYSSRGPGRLEKRKPDVVGYTHFAGSGVYTADSGTSAATPVVSGVVAAIRSKRPLNAADLATSPAAIRQLVRSTAQDLGSSGFDFVYGHGLVDGCALARKLCPSVIPVPPRILCLTYPWLCDPDWICRRFPWICEPRIPDLPDPPVPPVPPWPPVPPTPTWGEAWASPAAVGHGGGDPSEFLMWLMGAATRRGIAACSCEKPAAKVCNGCS